MSNDELQKILMQSNTFADAKITVTGDGRHFTITIISELFTNLKKLQRQQKVNQVLKPYLTDDANGPAQVHAVVLKLFTPEEHNNNNRSNK